MASGKTSRLSRIAFWLVPAPDPRRSLQELIDQLSRRYASPSFLPHLTIWSCARPHPSAIASLLERLPGKTAAISLQTLGLEGSDCLKRAFYLRLEANGALHEFVEQIQGLTSKWASAHILDPHLSLLYQVLPQPERLKLMDEFSPQPAEVCFDELRVVAVPRVISTPADLHGWQTLAIHRLERGRP